MTDTTNPRARLDAALEDMRHTKSRAGHPERITMQAMAACAEALSLLVDAQLAQTAPEPEPEPEPDSREDMPDDTPVGHGWVMGWGGARLFKPHDCGGFTWWLGHEWGVHAHWRKSGLPDPRPATVGDLRRMGVPVTEWPDIAEPEAEPVEPPEGSVVLVGGIAYQRIINYWYEAGEETACTWDDLCVRNEPTVIYTREEQ